MPNKELAYKVLDDIENFRFNWNQNVWVRSRILSSPVTENECGTSYCFAGRVVALSGRKQLYETRDIIQMKKTRDVVRASGYFTALSGEKSDIVSRRSGYTTFYMYDADSMNLIYSDTRRTGREDRLYVIEDGKFVRYYGRAVHARTAAARDLGISREVAFDLFSSSNSFNKLVGVVQTNFGAREDA